MLLRQKDSVQTLFPKQTADFHQKMNRTSIVIILLCFLAAVAVVLWERRKVRKTMEEIERMLDAAMTGSFSETNFDESQLSAE